MSVRVNLTPSKRSVIRHQKTISEYINYERPPEDDILHKLYQYRRKKSSHTSPVKEVNFNSTDKSLPAYRRPVSAPNNNLIASALLTNEISPLKVTSSNLLIEQSVERLYRGSRPAHQYSNSHNTALFKLAEVKCESKVREVETNIIKLEEEMGNKLLDDLLYLKSLKFDLELNWEIVQGKDNFPPENKIGVFYVLQDKIKNSNMLGRMRRFNIDDIAQELKECTRLFRDVLRGIMCKGAEDEAILMEMLWKVIMKVIDGCIGLHELSLSSVIECTRARLRSLSEENSNKLRKVCEEFKIKEERLARDIAGLTKNISEISKEKHEINKALNDKSRILSELTEIESQEKACVELRTLLGKLTSYINESEIEQTKQENVLNYISIAMKSSHLLQKPPDTRAGATETNWVLQESYLPENEFPVVSSYPLHSILTKKVKVPPRLNAISLCQSALENCDGQLSFYKELVIYLLSLYKDKESVVTAIRGIYQQIVHDDSISARLFLMLLNNSQSSFMKIEQSMFKINLLFIKNSENSEMALPKLIEFLQNYMSEERVFCEDLLECLSQIYAEKDLYLILLYRIQIAIEKAGKGLKGCNGSDFIPIAEFADWARDKLNLWMCSNDIRLFLTKQSNNISMLSLTSNENQTPIKIKEIKIDKEGLLLAFGTVAYKNYHTSCTQINAVDKIEDFQSFKEALCKFQREIPERSIFHSFAEVILGTPISDIFEKILNFEFISLNISENLKSRKKQGKQGKKSKK